jgi:hypothetical protein
MENLNSPADACNGLTTYTDKDFPAGKRRPPSLDTWQPIGPLGRDVALAARLAYKRSKMRTAT